MSKAAISWLSKDPFTKRLNIVPLVELDTVTVQWIHLEEEDKEADGVVEMPVSYALM